MLCLGGQYVEAIVMWRWGGLYLYYCGLKFRLHIAWVLCIEYRGFDEDDCTSMGLVVRMVCSADIIPRYGEIGFACEVCFAEKHDVCFVLV